MRNAPANSAPSSLDEEELSFHYPSGARAGIENERGRSSGRRAQLSLGADDN
jgi:hypothetical protein